LNIQKANEVQLSQYLYRRLHDQGWLEQDPNAEVKSVAGLVVQIHGEQTDWPKRYVVEPASLNQAVLQFADKFDLAALITLSSDITSYMFAQINHGDSEVKLNPHNITVPVIDCLADLVRDDLEVTRRDFCCLVRKERVVLAWSNQADQLLTDAANVESKLMGSVSLPCILSSGSCRGR
jgi:hypothetical protein